MAQAKLVKECAFNNPKKKLLKMPQRTTEEKNKSTKAQQNLKITLRVAKAHF